MMCRRTLMVPIGPIHVMRSQPCPEGPIEQTSSPLGPKGVRGQSGRKQKYCQQFLAFQTFGCLLLCDFDMNKEQYFQGMYVSQSINSIHVDTFVVSILILHFSAQLSRQVTYSIIKNQIPSGDA